MSKSYMEYKQLMSKKIDDLPMIVAFTNWQLESKMEEVGLKKDDLDKIVSIGAGVFSKKSDVKVFNQLRIDQERELQASISADQTGEGFIYEMFKYELNNYEYGYTRDVEDTLEALGMTLEEIYANPAMKIGFEKAKNEIINASNEEDF